MSEGVCQSCLSRRQRALSGAERWFATVHQHDVDARYLRKRQDRISGPVPAGNLTAVEHDLLLQGDTDGLNDPALKLVSCTIGVHDTADIGGDHDPRSRFCDRCLRQRQQPRTFRLSCNATLSLWQSRGPMLTPKAMLR